MRRVKKPAQANATPAAIPVSTCRVTERGPLHVSLIDTRQSTPPQSYSPTHRELATINDNASITFSLLSELANQVQKLSARQGLTRSQLAQEALRRYIEDIEWERVTRNFEQKAREAGIGPEDVADLIDEHRSELASGGTVT